MAQTVSELVLGSRFEVESFDDHIVQTRFIPNPAEQHQQIREKEKWQRTKELGRGTFGIVWLEKCIAGPGLGKVRAVKELGKGSSSSSNYYHELEAIQTFSQEKVCRFSSGMRIVD